MRGAAPPWQIPPMLGETALTLTFLSLWIRVAMLALIGALAPVAVLAWAARTRRLPPFGAASRLIRRLTDPVLDPLHRRFGRYGVRQDTAPWWALLLVLLASATLVIAVQLLQRVLGDLYLASQGVGAAIPLLLLGWGFALLRLALIVRVIGSWFAWERTAFGRLAWSATEWLLAPIRRRLPRWGVVDLAPMVAWFLLALAEQLLRAFA